MTWGHGSSRWDRTKKLELREVAPGLVLRWRSPRAHVEWEHGQFMAERDFKGRYRVDRMDPEVVGGLVKEWLPGEWQVEIPWEPEDCKP